MMIEQDEKEAGVGKLLRSNELVSSLSARLIT